MSKIDYKNIDRKTLIQICKKAIVNKTNWGDRDSGEAHLNVGRLWALLSAGCDYVVTTVKDDYFNLDVTYAGFCDIENFQGDETYVESGYLPTLERLKTVKGDDWY